MRAFSVIAFMLLMVGSSEAQTPTHMLKGTKAFDLIVDSHKPSHACGIVEVGIQEQVIRIAQSMGLHLSPVDKRSTLRNFTLRLETITKHGIFTSTATEAHHWDGSICMTSVRLTAFAPPKVARGTTGYKGGGLTILWTREVVQAGNVVGHKFRVEREARDLAKQFTMDWALDNRP